MTALYGLLGRKLGHSRSPELHRALAGYDYDLFPVEPEDLEAFLKQTPCRGLNVTIPYKKAVVGYCTELSEAARRLGSVNTMVRRHDGWYGDNTDYAGFCALIAPFAPAGRRALVLGSGGAGTMALQALRPPWACGPKPGAAPWSFPSSPPAVAWPTSSTTPCAPGFCWTRSAAASRTPTAFGC